eukprot:1096249-Amphidinium_carterae.3
MGTNLNLQAMRELVEVEAQARIYHHSRWSQLEQQVQIEYNRSRLAQLDAAFRVKRWAQGQNVWVSAGGYPVLVSN